MTEKKLSFAIFGSKSGAAKSNRISELIEKLRSKNATIYVEKYFLNAIASSIDREAKRDICAFEVIDFSVDFIISLGGDGTFLRAIGRTGSLQVPIIGVNMGRLGFLANIPQEELNLTIDNIYANEFSVEERAVIKLECPDREIIINPFALNDIAILKRDMACLLYTSPSPRDS